MILVTGGTGRLGNQIVRVLRSVGLDVRCLVRKGSEYFWLNDTGASYFFGDLRDPESLSRALRDVRYLIAAAGVRVEKTDNNHKNVTADGNIALFDAAKARKVEHVVFVSCAGAGDPRDVPALTGKKAAEDHLIASGLSHTILRPGLFAANFADLARRAETNGAIFLPGRADAKISPLHGRDLALMCTAALDLPSVKNQVIEVGGPDTMTVEQAWATMAEVARVPANAWKVPPTVLRGLAPLARPFGRRWQNHLLALDAWFSRDTAVDGAETAARFGIPLTPYREACESAWADRHPGEDPTAREEKVVHRQFVATIYEPGTIKYEELPEGPPPRRD
ncbi:MAG: SDR family oxidoreductase [Pseudomonadota bacterium]|nr:SDR family oxidoreductase [Pseudomonadota bacterium]